jgi:hypothetical protein
VNPDGIPVQGADRGSDFPTGSYFLAEGVHPLSCCSAFACSPPITIPAVILQSGVAEETFVQPSSCLTGFGLLGYFNYFDLFPILVIRSVPLVISPLLSDLSVLVYNRVRPSI